MLLQWNRVSEEVGFCISLHDGGLIKAFLALPLIYKLIRSFLLPCDGITNQYVVWPISVEYVMQSTSTLHICIACLFESRAVVTHFRVELRRIRLYWPNSDDCIEKTT